MSAERDDREELSEEMLAALRREALGHDAEADEVREDSRPRLTGRRKGGQRGKRLVLPKETGTRNWSPEQRLLILDTWRRPLPRAAASSKCST